MTDTPEALKAPFDPVKLEEARTALAAARTEVDDSAARLDEMFQRTQGDDGTGFTAEDQAAYNNMAIAHKNLEGRHARLEADVRTMELRDPAKAAARAETQTDDSALLERYLRASSDREASEMLASDDFKGHVTGSDAGKGVPSNSLRLSSMIAAKVRSDNASGEDAVDSTTYRGIIDRLQEYGGMSQVAYSFSTATGEPFIVPRADNASQEGEILSNQGTSVSDQSVNNIGSVELGAETVSSKRMAISNEMIQDSVFDIQSWVMRTLVRRIGRLKNRVCTTGFTDNAKSVDAGDFNGIVPVAKDSSVTLASNGSVTYANLVDLIYSIDPAYRMGGESGEGGFKPGMGRVAFMFNEAVEKQLVKLVDNEGRPLWNVSTRVGEPNSILGYSYVVNQHMDDLSTSGNKPILFGDFSYFWIRNIAGISLFNFWDSNTAPANERHLLGFYRGACDYVGPVDSNSKADAIAFADRA